MTPYHRLQELAQPLFTELFCVVVAYKDSMSVTDLKRFGMVTTGDKKLDALMYEDEVTRYIKISDMVQYWRDSISFRICSRADAARAYGLIHAYLQGWLSHLSRAINIGDVPVDDLMSLDALANILHPYSQERPVNMTRPTLPGFDPGELFTADPSVNSGAYESVIPQLSRIMNMKTPTLQTKGKLPWS